MTFLRILVMVPAFVLFPAEAKAQEWCSPPMYESVERFKIRLLERAQAEQPSARVVGSALAPVCPKLPLDTDLSALMADLLHWSLLQQSPRLLGSIAQGVREALAHDRERVSRSVYVVQDVVRPSESRVPYQAPPLRIPIDALRSWLESGAGPALDLVRSLAVLEPQVAALLIELARSSGPPSRSELPADMLEMLFGWPRTGEEAIRAELARDPGLIRNPRARCIVERGPDACPRGGGASGPR